MRKSIEARVERAIRERVFPGCVVGVVRKDGERTILPCGTMIYHSAAVRVREDTIYDLASVTKSIPTASLALTYIAEGKIRLEEAIKTYLPELQHEYGATVEDLLRYRVKGGQMSKLRLSTTEEIRTHVFAHGFDGPPGEEVYTNLPAYLLGLVVERVGGDTLSVLARERFFDPLGMSDTTFFPHDTQRVAPTEIDERGEVRGLPHDESAYVFAKAGRAVGHAGLFSTAGDVLNFLEALLRDRLPAVADGAQRGLGWQVRSARFMGEHGSARAFGKTGFTGTSIVCDIERGVACVILSNRTYPKRPENDSGIARFRADIATIVFQ